VQSVACDMVSCSHTTLSPHPCPYCSVRFFHPRHAVSFLFPGPSYCRILAQMCQAPSFAMSADYVRLRMASAARGRASHASTNEAVLESARAAAVKAAEVSSERRRAGHVPGDRVSMSQLQKDIQRDAVDVDGLSLRGPQAGFLLAALAKRVAAAVKGESDERWVVAGDGDTANGFETAVLDFAREVLLCSSRTVTGGDAYDAAEMVRCEEGLWARRAFVICCREIGL